MTFDITVFVPITRIDFLSRCIKSLNYQTDKCFKVLFLDNTGSLNSELNKTIKTIIDPVITYIVLKTDRRIGDNDPTESWNFGLNQIQTEYFILMGDDDYIANNYIKEIKKIISDFPDSNIYRSKVATVDSNDTITRYGISLPQIETWDEYIYYRNMYRRCKIQSTTEFCIKTKAIKRINGYQPSPYAVGSDDLTYIMLMLDSPVISTNRTTAYWRRHGQNFSIIIPDKKRTKAMEMVINNIKNIVEDNISTIIPKKTLLELLENSNPKQNKIRRLIMFLWQKKLTKPIINYCFKKNILPPL